ncbi:MAG: serine/threonine-protein phosphatase [Anaerolineae bacterium]|nr:serine/threonine-protein phosphatase [Anaerolineae bacterium]
MSSAKPDLYFHHAGLTDTGLLRSHNEDALKLPVDVDADTLAQKGYFFVLADGMGGHQKGEVASAVTIETTHQEYYASVDSLDRVNPADAIIKAMTAAIEKANDQVLHATEGGGTTVVAATLYNSVLVVMNIGDSRAYLLRNNELNLISRDHSLVFRLREMGKITEEEALNHPRQNVLYQALGQGDDLEIHVFTDKLQLGDTIILCSDGLWGPVGDEAIKEILRSPVSPREATRQLVDMANAAGGPDNITTIVIRVCDEESPADNCLPEVEAARPPAAADDTLPFLEVRPKPHTLPEGKFYVVKD